MKSLSSCESENVLRTLSGGFAAAAELEVVEAEAVSEPANSNESDD